jgi:hypothetical protein
VESVRFERMDQGTPIVVSRFEFGVSSLAFGEFRV